VTIEAPEETRFVVTAAMVEAAHDEKKLDGLLLMSPANPTGAMMSGEALRDILRDMRAAGRRVYFRRGLSWPDL